MGPDIRQCGGAGPHTVPGGKTVWGAGPQTVLSYSTCGGDGPHNILSLSFVYLLLLSGEMGPDIRLGPTLSLENNSCFLMADKN